MAENLLSPKQLNKHLERLQQSLPMALVNRFTEIDLLTQAASLSFYALLSLAPLLVLLLWLTASLYPAAQATLITQIEQLAGNSAATVAKTILQNATAQPTFGTLAGLWSTLLLFIGATAVFAQLQNALNLIFHTDQRRLEGIKAWLKKRVFSFGVVLALGFLLIISMVATTALQVVFTHLPSMLPTIGYLSTLVLYTLAFAFYTAIYQTEQSTGAKPTSAAQSPLAYSHWVAMPSGCTSAPQHQAAPTAQWVHWSLCWYGCTTHPSYSSSAHC